jgi:hypothetical protein
MFPHELKKDEVSYQAWSGGSIARNVNCNQRKPIYEPPVYFVGNPHRSDHQ